MAPIEEREGGVCLNVRASPGSSRDRIVGMLGDALKVAVCAPPERGKANHSIIRLLAKELGLPARTITLLSGSTSKNKRFAIRDVSVEDARDRLARALAPEEQT